MKKQLIFATLAGMLLSLNGVGQNEKYSVGIEAGPNIGVLYGNEFLNDFKPGLGFSAGATFQYNFPNLFSIRTKLAFEQKVAKTEVISYNQDGSVFYEGQFINEFKYVTLPILARISLGNQFKFYGDLGAFLGILISNKQKYRVEGYQYPDYDNTNNIRRIDAGITAGIGCSYQVIDNLLLTLNVRNSLGLVNTSKLPVSGNGMIATNVTNFLVGIDYCFGSRE